MFVCGDCQYVKYRFNSQINLLEVFFCVNLWFG